MAYFTGRTGSITVDSNSMAKLRDWSLETTVELLSTNVIGDFANTFVPGFKGATGSATLLYYRTETEDGNDLQFTTLLNKVHKVGAITEADKVELILNVGTDVKDDVKFNAYITSASISVSTAELTVVPINFTVDGDFTEFINA